MKYVIVTHRKTGEAKKCYLAEAAEKTGICERTMSQWANSFISNDIGTNTRYVGNWKLNFQVAPDTVVHRKRNS